MHAGKFAFGHKINKQAKAARLLMEHANQLA